MDNIIEIKGLIIYNREPSIINNSEEFIIKQVLKWKKRTPFTECINEDFSYTSVAYVTEVDKRHIEEYRNSGFNVVINHHCLPLSDFKGKKVVVINSLTSRIMQIRNIVLSCTDDFITVDGIIFNSCDEDTVLNTIEWTLENAKKGFSELIEVTDNVYTLLKSSDNSKIKLLKDPIVTDYDESFDINDYLDTETCNHIDEIVFIKTV